MLNSPVTRTWHMSLLVPALDPSFGWVLQPPICKFDSELFIERSVWNSLGTLK